jgi:two-component system, OmpR family, sensor histidine kinase BaeS
MANPNGPGQPWSSRSWTGRLGLQLTLAFVGVALAGVITAVLVASLTVTRDVDQLGADQRADLATAVAVGVGKAYAGHGWAHANLAPVAALVVDAGAGLQVRGASRRLISSSPGFYGFSAASRITDAVVDRGRQVGFVTLAFGPASLGQELNAFSFERWRARIEAAGIAVLIALLVALPLSWLISNPVDKLIAAARTRGRGELSARVGSVRGPRKLHELALAFDEMAQVREEQDQVRRNLVADVAHELRTPIAVLQASHEAMLDGLTEPTPEYLAAQRDEVVRLAKMADDLQRLASAEAAALQLTLIRRDLAAIAATAATSLLDSFEAANVTLVERLTKVEVMCDPLRMHEVVVNLLTNALKFTSAEGQVTLETRQTGTLGLLKVADTGVGIPPDELPHVAERFFRGQRSAQVAGSGIGLAIVAELVRAHHGSISFESQPGQGTTVTVTLPLNGEKSALARPDMPPRYPDAANALDVVAQRDGGARGLPAHPVPP